MGPGCPYLATTAQGQDGSQRDNDGLRQTHPHAATLPTAHQRDTERSRLQQFRPGRISGGNGLERAQLISAGTDSSGRGLGHFVPGAGEVAERLGHHQPSLLTQVVEDLDLGV